MYTVKTECAAFQSESLPDLLLMVMSRVTYRHDQIFHDYDGTILGKVFDIVIHSGIDELYPKDDQKVWYATVYYYPIKPWPPKILEDKKQKDAIHRAKLELVAAIRHAAGQHDSIYIPSVIRTLKELNEAFPDEEQVGKDTYDLHDACGFSYMED